jgi:formylglycine-generating enzyme required for sulfatase activity
MHGNVWEWVEDCYQSNYDGAPTDGSARISPDCTNHVVRGGSWVAWQVPRTGRSPAAVPGSGFKFHRPPVRRPATITPKTICAALLASGSAGHLRLEAQ